MELKNFVQIYDEILPWNVLSNLIRYANVYEFCKAQVGGAEGQPVEDLNIRKAHVLPLSNFHPSLSQVHWCNLLQNYFGKNLKKYSLDKNILEPGFSNIVDIQILKYENTGFYTWHTDHFAECPRTMSCILLLNNDYEGGNLCFRNPDGSGEWQIDVKPNRMIIWPSNFLYPHTVKPVTKGTRYSVVAWAL
jgi:hypothetical protein